MRTLGFIFTLFLFSLAACVQQKAEYQVAPPQGTDNNAPTSPSSPAEKDQASLVSQKDCYGPGVGPGHTEYYNLPNVVAHGKKASEVVWSSAMDPRLVPEDEQAIFQTSSRLNLRLLVFPSPGKGDDYQGNYCRYAALPYTKLQIKVGVRNKDSQAYFAEYIFDDIETNSCSQVHSFDVPGSTSSFVIDVLNVKWDYDCIHYTEQGFPDVEQCPWALVWEQECFEFSIQMATDFTKDIPHNDESEQ